MSTNLINKSFAKIKFLVKYVFIGSAISIIINKH